MFRNFANIEKTFPLYAFTIRCISWPPFLVHVRHDCLVDGGGNSDQLVSGYLYRVGCTPNTLSHADRWVLGSGSNGRLKKGHKVTSFESYQFCELWIRFAWQLCIITSWIHLNFVGGFALILLCIFKIFANIISDNDAVQHFILSSKLSKLQSAHTVP